MTILGTAFVEIAPEVSNFASKLTADVKESVDKAATASSSSFDKLANIGQKAFLGIAAAAGVLGVAAVKAALEGQEAQAQLATAIDNTGVSYESIGSRVEKLTDSQAKFGITNDQAEEALTRLVQTTGDAGESMDLLSTTVNLAAARHLDLTAAAQLVGRAAEGQITPLKRMGIVVEDTGSSAGNAEAAIKALNDRFGGAAQAQADTYAGKLKAFQAEVGNLTEKLGNALLPILGGVAGAMGSTIGFFEKNQTAAITLAAVVGGPLAVAMGAYIVQEGVLVAGKIGEFFASAGKLALVVKDAVLQAAVSFQTLSVSELVAEAPLALVAGAIAILTGGISLQGKATHDVTDATKKYADQIKGSGDEASILKDKIAELTKQRDDEYLATERAAVKNGTWADVSAQARAKADDQSKAINELKGRLKDLTVTSEQSTVAHKDLAAAQDKAGLSATSLAGEFGVTTSAVQALADKMKIDLTKATEDQIDQLGLAAARLKETSPKALELKDALAKLSDLTADATEKSKAFKSALDLLIGGNVDAEKAVVSFYNQIDTLGTKLLADGANLDFHTQKGRDNLSVIEDTVTAIRNHIESMQHSGAAADDMRRALDGDTKAFDDQLKKAGFTTQQIKDLNSQYGLVPSSVNTVVTADFSQLYKAAADAAAKIPFNVTQGLSASVKLNATTRTFAEGGWVNAPPGMAVPAIVHGGEFVLSRDMLANGAGRGDVSVTVNVNGPTDRSTVDYLREQVAQVMGEVLDRAAAGAGRRQS